MRVVLHDDTVIVGRFIEENDRYCKVRVKGKKRQWLWSKVKCFGIHKHHGGRVQDTGQKRELVH